MSTSLYRAWIADTTKLEEDYFEHLFAEKFKRDNQMRAYFEGVWLVTVATKFTDKLFVLSCKRSIQIMAKKSSKTGTFEGWSMVEVALTTAEKQQFNKWLPENYPLLEEHLTAICHEGYKWSFRYSEDQDRFYATVTQLSDTAKDARSSLTSHAQSIVKAMLLTVFKLNVICKGSIVQRTTNADEDYG